MNRLESKPPLMGRADPPEVRGCNYPIQSRISWLIDSIMKIPLSFLGAFQRKVSVVRGGDQSPENGRTIDTQNKNPSQEVSPLERQFNEYLLGNTEAGQENEASLHRLATWDLKYFENALSDPRLREAAALVLEWKIHQDLSKKMTDHTFWWIIDRIELLRQNSSKSPVIKGVLVRAEIRFANTLKGIDMFTPIEQLKNSLKLEDNQSREFSNLMRQAQSTCVKISKVCGMCTQEKILIRAIGVLRGSSIMMLEGERNISATRAPRNPGEISPVVTPLLNFSKELVRRIG